MRQGVTRRDKDSHSLATSTKHADKPGRTLSSAGTGRLPADGRAGTFDPYTECKVKGRGVHTEGLSQGLQSVNMEHRLGRSSKRQPPRQAYFSESMWLPKGKVTKELQPEQL